MYSQLGGGVGRIHVHPSCDVPMLLFLHRNGRAHYQDLFQRHISRYRSYLQKEPRELFIVREHSYLFFLTYSLMALKSH